ncbi:MAG: hypothetical protein EON48_12225 [Acetobacteraceae bacterium]|nr:MAG: hypothetical protein EON48_12225 [Acetobacteraceae bacterium]
MKKYFYTFGSLPNVIAPRTFNEKVNARKFFDHRPIFNTWVDKLAVRDWVAAVKPGYDRLLPALLHVTAEPSDIPFDQLPDRFVIKASHGSGWLRIVKDKSTLNRDAVIAECREWLSLNYYDINLEAVYRNIPPRIMIEEFLDNGCGEAPEDYKLYVFHGRVEIIQVDVARFGQHRRKIYDRDWQEQQVELSVPTYTGTLSPPPQLAEVIEVAETLAGTIDFVRVDLYVVGDQVYFGEMTPSSGNGFNRFTPVSFDAVMGSFWKLAPPPRLLLNSLRQSRDTA